MRRLTHRFANWLARLTEPESFAEYLDKRDYAAHSRYCELHNIPPF
jgi:hypothetical protein